MTPVSFLHPLRSVSGFLIHTDQSLQRSAQIFSDEMRQLYIDTWKNIFPRTQTAFEPTIDGALKLARSFDQGAGTQNLITGSLYLVGGALRILEPHV